jgi:hypothetical protein
MDFPAISTKPTVVKNLGAWGNGIESIRKIAPVPAPAPAAKTRVTKKVVKEDSSSDEEDDWEDL